MKIGDEYEIITFWLGKLKVATIRRFVMYGVSYVPEVEQTVSEGVHLSHFGKEHWEKCATVLEARKKIKALCGAQNFVLLKETLKFNSDVKETEVQAALWRKP